MAIGPEARDMASGRLVVAAGLIGAIGFAAVVLGSGPIVVAAGPTERAIGTLAIGLGIFMMVAAISLALRLGPAKRLGIASGVAAILLGVLVTIAAIASMGSCEARASGEAGCSVVVAGTAAVGLGVVAAGAGCTLVIRRAPPAALRRNRRQSRSR
jgi:hypothetical protein